MSNLKHLAYSDTFSRFVAPSPSERSPARMNREIESLLDRLEGNMRTGEVSQMNVGRSWSEHVCLELPQRSAPPSPVIYTRDGEVPSCVGRTLIVKVLLAEPS